MQLQSESTGWLRVPAMEESHSLYSIQAPAAAEKVMHEGGG